MNHFVGYQSVSHVSTYHKKTSVRLNAGFLKEEMDMIVYVNFFSSFDLKATTVINSIAKIISKIG